jgi:hypothetical protein
MRRAFYCLNPKARVLIKSRDSPFFFASFAPKKCADCAAHFIVKIFNHKACVLVKSRDSPFFFFVNVAPKMR